jgi:predicted Fe-Mo cluster-binding NifX family protein
MIVAVAASGTDLEAQTDPRFGRCGYFVLVNTETMESRAMENTAALQGSGAGIAAVQMIANAGAEAVIAGNLGPNAFQTLAAGGIKAYSYPGGTVRQAVEALQAGTLTEIGGANVPSHFGMGAGGGMGVGRGRGGMGGGMGRGMGRGMGMGRNVPGPVGSAPPGTPVQVEQLGAQAEALEAQLQDLRRQLDDLLSRREEPGK